MIEIPKQTFFNLNEEKREKILEIAIDEFSKQSFKLASVTKIAEAAGIAKGSIYQYFDDKKDLYRYVLDITSNKKVEYLMSFMNNMEELKFLDLIRKLYLKGIQFARDNPKLAAIGSNFLKESDASFKEEIMGKGIEKSNEIFEMLIEKAKKKGEIDEAVDTKVGAYLISTLNLALSDLVLSHMKYEDVLSDEEVLFDKLEKMLYIIQNGIKPKDRR